MATTRALAADGEVVQSTELIVTSALATWVTCFLPPVGDGTASTVVDNSQVAFYANALGGIYVKDQYGHLIGVVNPGDSALFTANVVTQGPLIVIDLRFVERLAEDYGELPTFTRESGPPTSLLPTPLTLQRTRLSRVIRHSTGSGP